MTAQHARRDRSPLVLVIGGIAATMLGLTRRNLEEVVLIMGVTLFLAWLVEASSPRYAGSGAMLLAIGIALFAVAHADVTAYANEILFLALGIGLLIVGKAAPRAGAGAGVTLIVVAACEWALVKLPPILHSSAALSPFAQGWAFALILTGVGFVALIRR